jgi:hypothetical protein
MKAGEIEYLVCRKYIDRYRKPFEAATDQTQRLEITTLLAKEMSMAKEFAADKPTMILGVVKARGDQCPGV